jgi:multicomponent Na+:H+ antiporter subunit C
VNLAIFTAGGLTHRKPAFISADTVAPAAAMANALPQAFILTAIVIGFALLVFMFVLFYRAYETMGTVDTRQMPEDDLPGNAPRPGAMRQKETPR